MLTDPGRRFRFPCTRGPRVRSYLARSAAWKRSSAGRLWVDSFQLAQTREMASLHGLRLFFQLSKALFDLGPECLSEACFRKVFGMRMQDRRREPAFQ